MPYPSHPSKLPKVAAPIKPKPLLMEDLDDDITEGAKQRGSKRKAVDMGEENERPPNSHVARRLDFT